VNKDGGTLRSGGMTEGPAGLYTAIIPALAPVHGNAVVHIEIACPGGPTQITDFNIYIDPSGVVRTVEGAPIVGARVTLYRSDTENGAYVIVPNGDAVMSPSNRTNPDYTDGSGRFGWDVIAGFSGARKTAASRKTRSRHTPRRASRSRRL
jgi:hypothetical protein